MGKSNSHFYLSPFNLIKKLNRVNLYKLYIFLYLWIECTANILSKQLELWTVCWYGQLIFRAFSNLLLLAHWTIKAVNFVNISRWCEWLLWLPGTLIHILQHQRVILAFLEQVVFLLVPQTLYTIRISKEKKPTSNSHVHRSHRPSMCTRMHTGVFGTHPQLLRGLHFAHNAFDHTFSLDCDIARAKGRGTS